MDKQNNIENIKQKYTILKDKLTNLNKYIHNTFQLSQSINETNLNEEIYDLLKVIISHGVWHTNDMLMRMKVLKQYNTLDITKQKINELTKNKNSKFELIMLIEAIKVNNEVKLMTNEELEDTIIPFPATENYTDFEITAKLDPFSLLFDDAMFSKLADESDFNTNLEFKTNPKKETNDHINKFNIENMTFHPTKQDLKEYQNMLCTIDSKSFSELLCKHFHGTIIYNLIDKINEQYFKQFNTVFLRLIETNQLPSYLNIFNSFFDFITFNAGWNIKLYTKSKHDSLQAWNLKEINLHIINVNKIIIDTTNKVLQHINQTEEHQPAINYLQFIVKRMKNIRYNVNNQYKQMYYQEINHTFSSIEEIVKSKLNNTNIIKPKI